MGTVSDKRYRLKIRRDGSVRYFMSDGSFWEPRNCPQLSIYEFNSRTDAELFWHRWALQYPVTARDWIPQWEVVE